MNKFCFTFLFIFIGQQAYCEELSTASKLDDNFSGKILIYENKFIIKSYEKGKLLKETEAKEEQVKKSAQFYKSVFRKQLTQSNTMSHSDLLTLSKYNFGEFVDVPQLIKLLKSMSKRRLFANIKACSQEHSIKALKYISSRNFETHSEWENWWQHHPMNRAKNQFIR